MDIAGIILNSVLNDPKKSLETWSKLKVQYFNEDYLPIYITISKYYDKYQSLPSFAELKITVRDQSTVQKVTALEILKIPEDIDQLVALEALIDQDTQEVVLDYLSDFVDKISTYDTTEVKKQLGNISLKVEERTDTSEEIYLMDSIYILDKEEARRRISLGLNNIFDANLGTALTELVMIGGGRGSGKTIAACNIAINQYNQGNVGLFFSIEMRYREIFNRFISILSNISNEKLRRTDCTPEDYEKIAVTRSNMFIDSQEVYQDYLKHRNYEKFEIDLIKSKSLKPDNQLIIVDNQRLTLADIDLNIQKFKTRFGDKLKTVVVDYVNQINIPDIYHWKTQIMLSNKLKEFARKYDIVIVTPYQTDASGEARLSKGILDKADIATIISPKEDYINFNSTKTRNIPPFEFNAPVNWSSLKILPTDAIINADLKDSEPSQDLPWT